jgi:nucleoside-diphosphate-sugar epimerase
MLRVTVIGAEGFVASAFVRLLKYRTDVKLVCVTRSNYDQFAGIQSDIVIEAACNSKKYLADENPLAEFEASVTLRQKTLVQFPAALHVHISSVDIYSELTTPKTTQEDSVIDLQKTSRYGVHKYLAEQLVQHYAQRWLIVRLAGSVGTGLRKNPVFDIMNGKPLRVHPESQYQFMNTDDAARLTWALVERETVGQIFNVCGTGLISMRDIADVAGKEMDLSQLPTDAVPRIVEVDNSKLGRLFEIPNTTETIRCFLKKRPAYSSNLESLVSATPTF